ncbi:phage tail protein [Campylobacter hyointestinalis]|uniref:phage tail protein n=1 Tax=Campylobacter hyointestinalis TaxID=198 RepID=UPI00072B2EE7|nr:phage tail protein [Campylobacter hyointestinalis]PPB63088.1 phage tail protein [Campylobacter hyointestinalis subsp. hyointestinalis]PPB65358.1 phage tail protein [Campylobacter hyointestinalis subsp. hyointestinalis]CUU72306.1 major tail sheath protein [Campylobacter hyointestinalis subsp. hyointestinalis]
MASKFGVNVELYNGSLKPYEIQNSRPIAIVGDDSTLESGLYIYSSVDKALEAVGSGSIKNALEDFKATSIHTQIILSTFKLSENENAETKKSENLASVLNAIDALKKAEAQLMAKPKFILAPEYNDSGVHDKLKQLGEYLRAVYAIEVDAINEQEALKAVENLQTKTAIISFQKVRRLDEVVRPASVFLISLYAKVMSETEYGFSQTYSNRVIGGIIGIEQGVEFIQGVDCEADRLRNAGITCVIADDGLRAWGGETRDEDFSSLHTYVIFYTAIDTIFEAQKSAIDKRMRDVLKNVVDSLEAFYRRLIANNVVVGFTVTVPTDINDNQTISEGKIYIKHEVQEMPLLKNITNRIYRVDAYSQVLIEEL